MAYTFAQHTVVADTFTHRKHFSFTQVILRSDSSFTLQERGCLSAHLYMGFWQRAADTFLLSCLYNTDVSTRTNISQSQIDPSVPIQFVVTDCYGNPLGGYAISFYKQNLTYDTTYQTDKNGTLTVKRGQYALYSAETDEANLDYFNQQLADMPLRPITDNTQTVHITLSYPKELVKENILLNRYYRYQSKKFVLINNQLIEWEAKRHVVYQSKRPVLLAYRPHL